MDMYKCYPERSGSRWKFNNKLDNLLGKWADKSEFGKCVYVGFYRVFDNKFYLGGLKMIDKQILHFSQLLQDVDAKLIKGGYKLLKRDIVYSLHRFGISFEEYFLYKFWRLSLSSRSDIICGRIWLNYYYELNSTDYEDLCTDKGKSYDFFKNYFHRGACVVLSEKDTEQLMNFLKKYDKVIVKPIAGMQGIGIQIIESKDVLQNKVNLLDVFKDGCIVEELLKQDNDFSLIYPKSINTLRLHCFKTTPEITYLAALRFGQGGNFVDNGHSGGIVCVLDVETGVVINAFDNSGKNYIYHPDTLKQLVGFKVPHWEEALALGAELLNLVEGESQIALDLALINEQWVFIEANSNGDLSFYQREGKGIKRLLDSLIKQH